MSLPPWDIDKAQFNYVREQFNNGRGNLAYWDQWAAATRQRVSERGLNFDDPWARYAFFLGWVAGLEQAKGMATDQRDKVATQEDIMMLMAAAVMFSYAWLTPEEKALLDTPT